MQQGRWTWARFEVSELSGPKEFFREDRVALDLRGSRLALRKQAPVLERWGQAVNCEWLRPDGG